MSFPLTSYLPTATIRDILKNTIAFDLDGDVIKCALYGDSSFTATINQDPSSYAGTGYGGEVTGTGWSAGGVTLTTKAVTLVTDVGVMFDADDVSESSTTLATAVKGCCIYSDTLSPKAIIAAVYFGSGTGYTTNNGTFGIQWDTNGIFRMTLHA